jgi:glyoxylase-like metal-dependent hydrolase (beta-lactamase superfamily II)
MGFEVVQIKGFIENAYLIKGDRTALVDTGARQSYRKIEKALRKNGVAPENIEFILMTHHHFDHAANLARLKRISGATVIAGALDAPVIEGTEQSPRPSDLNRIGRLLRKLPPKMVASYQSYEPCEVDRKLEDGDVIEELGLEAVALPGHTAGGMGYIDREGKRAFTGDMASKYKFMWSMPSLSFSDNLKSIFESQDSLVSLGLETAYAGHGVVITPDASAQIARFVTKQKAKRAG